MQKHNHSWLRNAVLCWVVKKILSQCITTYIRINIITVFGFISSVPWTCRGRLFIFCQLLMVPTWNFGCRLIGQTLVLNKSHLHNQPHSLEPQHKWYSAGSSFDFVLKQIKLHVHISSKLSWVKLSLAKMFGKETVNPGMFNRLLNIRIRSHSLQDQRMTKPTQLKELAGSVFNGKLLQLLVNNNIWKNLTTYHASVA